MTKMDNVAIHQAIEFLNQQPALAPVSDYPARAPMLQGRSAPKTLQVDDGKGVWTDVSGSVVFADAFSADVKQDILYCWEYCQRWANKKIHDKYGKTDPSRDNADTIFVHTQEWYTFFEQCMAKLHWVTKSWTFKPVHVSGSTVEVDKIILDVMMAFMGDDAEGTKAIEDAVALIKGLGGDSDKLTLWNSHSSSAGLGNFQMGAVQDAGDGLAMMKTGALQIDSTQHNTDCFFFFHYSSTDTKVTQATQQLMFNHDAYGRVVNGKSAKSLVENAVAGTSIDFLEDLGDIE